MKILIPTSITLDEEKLGLEPGDTVRHYNPTEPIAEEDTDAEVLIAWANTADQLADSARRMKNVGLIQALLAGPDAVRAAGFTPDAAICAGVGLHSKTVAEHALALTLNFVRFLPTLAQATVEHRWAEELGGAQELHPKDQVTTLLDANVLVWGFGSIGQETARLFKAFGANVTGVAQSAGERSGFPVIATEQLDEYLPTTDILVMVLPTSDSTFKA
ncbi:MAG: NAD(P)-dependent oxidoreductase, partial [Rothia dentocariosa]